MKNEKYTVEKIVQEFYGQSMTEDEGFIAPDFFAMAREIFNLRAERDALLKDVAAMREVLEFARIELGGKERDGSEHTHWCVACDDHVDGNHAVRVMIDAALAVQPITGDTK